MVINLLHNAVEAMAACADGARDLSVASSLREDQQVAVSVRDSGVGLPPTDADIFTPFFTTKRGGLGLGLAICASIVQAHGGAVWAARNADRGATIGFTLPVHE